MAQLVQVVSYNPDSRGFDSRWCHWNFSLTQSFRPHYCPGVASVSNRNKYHEYFLRGKGGRCVGLTTLTPWYPDCTEIWKPQPSATLNWRTTSQIVPASNLCHIDVIKWFNFESKRRSSNNFRKIIPKIISTVCFSLRCEFTVTMPQLAHTSFMSR